MSRLSLRLLLIGLAFALVPLTVPSSALADGWWAGSDPASNFTENTPNACFDNSASPACINGTVYQLNLARASLGQGPYLVPANFATLTPAEQAFILTDLDRVLYGLAPVPGLTSAQSADATAGAEAQEDPVNTDPNVIGYTGNWAADAGNMPTAYLKWMYDDGHGSFNVDCTPTDPGGCWGHRHDILWETDPSATLVMGAGFNAGVTQPNEDMLIGELAPGVTPTYSYTWQQAVAGGAANGATPVSTSPAPPAAPLLAATVTSHVRGHQLIVVVRMTHGRGTVAAVAIRGPRHIRAALRRSGSVVRGSVRLTSGRWTLRITYAAAAGWRAPPARTRTITIR